MLLNVSYNDPTIKEQIDKAVGKPYTIRERFKLKGVGSPKLFITATSLEIHNLLILDKYINTSNIELRPNGIVIRFRSLLETFALIIPYYKLSLYKGSADEYSFYKNQYFIKVKAESTNTQLHKFIKKITNKKAEISSHNGDVYL